MDEMPNDPAGNPRPLTAAARERVAAAVRSGNLIEAVKLYRQDTASSLLEARNAVEAMAAVGRDSAPGTAVVDAIVAGRKITAIKQYRLDHRVDLRTAKERVEAIEADLRQTTPERFAGPPAAAAAGGCGRVVLVVLVIAFTVAVAVAWHPWR